MTYLKSVADMAIIKLLVHLIAGLKPVASAYMHYIIVSINSLYNKSIETGILASNRLYYNRILLGYWNSGILFDSGRVLLVILYQLMVY